MDTRNCVFISYAREDQSWAERLYMDLRKQEINAWLDVRCLGAGADWKREIRKAIRDSRYFVLLLSRHSVNKRGFVQRELKEALDTLKDFPAGSTFLIPVRLDSTEPVDDELHALNWVNLLPDYANGLGRILSALAEATPAPLIVTGSEAKPHTSVSFVDKGVDMTRDTPVMVGPRAPISYAPFRSRREFLQQFFDRLPSENIFADRSLSYYITLYTPHPGVSIGDDLKQRYPEYIMLVLQNAFRDLQARQDGVSVILAFGGVERTLAIPYDAIRQIRVPEIGLAITLDPGPAAE